MDNSVSHGAQYVIYLPFIMLLAEWTLAKISPEDPFGNTESYSEY
jgi:hypothetical protein